MKITELKDSLPDSMKRYATTAVLNQINDICDDPQKAQAIRQNVLSYSSILNNGKFKLSDYVNAVAFISFTIMGHKHEEAYALTFPERYARLKKKGTKAKDLSAYVAAYRGNKLVKMIAEQSIIPGWIMYSDVYQQAILVQKDIMLDTDVSAMVRQKAADSLMDKLAPPTETVKAEANIGVSADSPVIALQQALTALAEGQHSEILKGAKTRDVSQRRLRVAVEEDIEDADYQD